MGEWMYMRHKTVAYMRQNGASEEDIREFVGE